MYEDIFIYVYICRLFPLPEDFLTALSIGKWDTYKCYYSLGIFTHIHVHVPYTKNANLMCKTKCETYPAYWQCHTYAYLKL